MFYTVTLCGWERSSPDPPGHYGCCHLLSSIAQGKLHCGKFSLECGILITQQSQANGFEFWIQPHFYWLCNFRQGTSTHGVIVSIAIQFIPFDSINMDEIQRYVLGLGEYKGKSGYRPAVASWGQPQEPRKEAAEFPQHVLRARKQIVWVPWLSKARDSCAAYNPWWPTRQGGVTWHFPSLWERLVVLQLRMSPRQHGRNLARASRQGWESSDLDSSSRNHNTLLFWVEERRKKGDLRERELDK